ncbi:MAG TPA: serine hydrolase domain-containing protein [Jiangellaceae bacterium]
MASRFTPEGLDNVRRTMAKAVEDGVPGLVWLLSAGDEVHRDAVGFATLDDSPMRVDSLFRIASLTKPITAVATLIAEENGVLSLDDPVGGWLPELADPTVLRHQNGPLTDTVPADRPITVRNLLTLTAGYGYDFTTMNQQAQISELARLGLGVGPPSPATMPDVDEWMRRLGTVPLDHQPGEAWRYHFGSEALGVLLARAYGEPLEPVLRRTVLDPLGMTDTRFSVPPAQLTRLTTAYAADATTGERTVYDGPSGQWARQPAFPSGGGGLVSTVADFWTFGRMLMSGGVGPDGPLLRESTVAAMTSDQLPANVNIEGSGDLGWGYGVDVQRRRGDGPRSPGSYSWTGGLGTTWLNDPSIELIGVVFTNLALWSPQAPPVIDEFWRAAYGAVA